MPDYLLHHTPGSCSRVVLGALEEIGVPYREQGVDLMRGAQRSPAYLAINPKGKVPVLVSDGAVLTELPAIVYHLANVHPDARLLPAGGDGVATLEGLSDLIWLAGTLQPLANRIFRPAAISQADPDGVKAGAIALLSTHAVAIAARLSNGRWWYGDDWSIADSFIAWIFWVAHGSGFPAAQFRVLLEHRARIEARPSQLRTLAREREAVARDDLLFPPGMSL